MVKVKQQCPGYKYQGQTRNGIYLSIFYAYVNLMIKVISKIEVMKIGI